MYSYIEKRFGKNLAFDYKKDKVTYLLKFLGPKIADPILKKVDLNFIAFS